MDRLRTYERPGETQTRTADPVIRIRLQHGRTQKDGWKLTETTVEFTGDFVDWPEIEAEMAKAYREGSAEARQRNILEGS
jgi:hypothetical protein